MKIQPSRPADFSKWKPHPKTFSEKKKPKPLSKKKKVTGELAMFEEIWQRRPHRSQFSMEHIQDFDVRCFSHVLPKSKYKQFRLNPKNVKILTADEHYMQTNVARSDWPQAFLEWWTFHENELKTMYKQQHG